MFEIGHDSSVGFRQEADRAAVQAFINCPPTSQYIAAGEVRCCEREQSIVHGTPAARRLGLSEYGTLAERYVRAFDQKWLRGGAPTDEPLLGSPDIQSLADLGNSVEVIQEMRAIPISRAMVIELAVFTLVPVVPLLLTMVSLEELLKKLVQIVL